MNRRPKPTRALRGALLAVTSAALTVTAHAAGGGGFSEFAQAVPLVVLIAGAAASLADRRSGQASVVAGLLTAQFAQHLLLSWVGHDHVTTLSPEMATAHVVAALLTGVLLFHAENALFTLVAAVSGLLPKRLAPLPATAPLKIYPRSAPPRITSVLHTRAHGRRGPPAVS